MAGLDYNRGAKRAREAREALGLDASSPVECLVTVAEQRYKVAVADLPDDIAGACYREGELAVLWVNGNHFAPRRRFTLAHELGHAWCRHDGTLEPDTVETLSGKTTNPYEIQANAFAAQFLMPRDGIERRVGGEPGLDDVVRLAAEFGVSAIAMVYRFKQLKLASEERTRRLLNEVEAGHHAELFDYLALQPLDDVLARLDELPYLTPGNHLAAALGGEAGVDRATAGAVDRLLQSSISTSGLADR
jgi:Zn-dependent peptidase ImmA (M78 family)